MKTILQILLLIIFAFKCNFTFAQTSFYDAKMIINFNSNDSNHVKWTNYFIKNVIVRINMPTERDLTKIEKPFFDYLDSAKVLGNMSPSLNLFLRQYFNTAKILKIKLNNADTLMTFITNNITKLEEKKSSYKIMKKNLINNPNSDLILQSVKNLNLKIDSIMFYTFDSLIHIITSNIEKNRIEDSTKLINFQKDQNTLKNQIDEMRAENRRLNRTTAELHIDITDIKFKSDFTSIENSNIDQYKNLINSLSPNFKSINQTLENISMPKSQTEAIDALAVFISKRFKQEVAISFFDKIKSFSDSLPILDTLFEKTSKLLNSQNGYEIPRLGSDWQYAFAEDISNLAVNIGKINWENSKWIHLSKEASEMIRISCEFLNKIYSNNNFVDIINVFDPKLDVSKTSSIYNYFRVLNVINKEFRSNKDGFYYLNFEDLRSLSPVESDVFIKLLYAYNKDIFDIVSKNSKSMLNSNKNTIYLTKFSNLLTTLSNYENTIKQINSQTSSINSLSINYVNQILDINYKLVKSSFDILEFINIENSTFSNSKKNLESFRHIVEILKNLENKNFGLMITNTFMLIDENRQINVAKHLNLIKPYLIQNENYKEFKSYLKSENFNKSLKKDSILISLINKIKKDTLIIQFIEQETQKRLSYISKYGSFLVDVLKSENSAELTNVVLSYAAEPSSYKIKKHYRSCVTINSFVGLYAASEWNSNTDFRIRDNHFFASGLTVPIGISVSFGLRNKTNSKLTNSKLFINHKGKLKNLNIRGSYGLTFNIFDIVAPFSYRFANSSNGEGLPEEIKINQIIAPGILFHRTIRNTPLIWTLGWQINPQLRKITSSGNTFQNTSKIYFGILFDIPLYVIYKK